jgi:hypothetical protein
VGPGDVRGAGWSCVCFIAETRGVMVKNPASAARTAVQNEAPKRTVAAKNRGRNKTAWRVGFETHLSLSGRGA